MKRAILILAFLWLFPFYSWADPSPGIRWLQNEPVTLFDWGMRNAEEHLRILTEDAKEFPAHVSKHQQTT